MTYTPGHSRVNDIVHASNSAVQDFLGELHFSSGLGISPSSLGSQIKSAVSHHVIQSHDKKLEPDTYEKRDKTHLIRDEKKLNPHLRVFL